MSSDFGNDIITISDEDGNDYTLEHLDTMEVDGRFYMACHPADDDEDDEHYSIVILEVDGDEELAAVEDDELLDNLYDLFMERLFDDDEEDEDIDGQDD